MVRKTNPCRQGEVVNAAKVARSSVFIQIFEMIFWRLVELTVKLVFLTPDKIVET